MIACAAACTAELAAQPTLAGFSLLPELISFSLEHYQMSPRVARPARMHRRFPPPRLPTAVLAKYCSVRRHAAQRRLASWKLRERLRQELVLIEKGNEARANSTAAGTAAGKREPIKKPRKHPLSRSRLGKLRKLGYSDTETGRRIK